MSSVACGRECDPSVRPRQPFLDGEETVPAAGLARTFDVPGAIGYHGHTGPRSTHNSKRSTDQREV